MSNFTKADIVDAIYDKTDIRRSKQPGAGSGLRRSLLRKEVQAVVDLFIDELKAAIITHRAIELRGFGTFEIKRRKGRQNARNPKTGEIIPIDSHGTVVFRPGQDLKRDVWPL